MPSPLGRRGEYFSASVRRNSPMWTFGRIRLLISRKLASTFHLISTSSARERYSSATPLPETPKHAGTRASVFCPVDQGTSRDADRRRCPSH